MNKMPWDPVKHLPAMVTVLWLAIFDEPICKAVRERKQLQLSYEGEGRQGGTKGSMATIDQNVFFRTYLPQNCHKIGLSGTLISLRVKTIVGMLDK